MIRIGLCDNKYISLEILEKAINECMVELNTEVEIFTYSSGKNIIEDFEKLDLIFMDIELSEMDGIETGKILRKKGYHGKIIVATAMIERFKEAFTINAFRFVTKPFHNEEIMEAIKGYIETRLGIDEIKVCRKRNEYMFPQKDILYAYSVNSAVELCMKDGIYRMESSLSDLENILDSRLFYKISKQYIVNMKKISKYANGKVTIQDVELNVSVRRKKEFEKAYQMFQVNYG